MTLLLVCTAAALSGCGGTKLPETYHTGEDSLPSLTALVSLDPAPECAEETEEDIISYHYTGLDAPAQAVTDYRDTLEADYNCVPLSAQGARLEEDQALSDSGQLVLAKESDSGSGLFQLDITWDDTSCTITPSFDEDAALPEESSSMTMQEAVEYLRSLPPSALGLTGDTMSGYDIFCEEGLVLLDGAPCLCLNVYHSGTYQCSLLFSPTSKALYRLNRSTGEVRPLSP